MHGVSHFIALKYIGMQMFLLLFFIIIIPRAFINNDKFRINYQKRFIDILQLYAVL